MILSTNSRERFLTAKEFKRYCKEVNVKLSDGELVGKDGKVERSQGELERYVSHGLVVPIVYCESPQPLFQQYTLPESDPKTDWHPFDIGLLAGDTELLKSKEVGGTDSDILSGAYFHHYQVHQIYELQKKWPLFAKHFEVLQVARGCNNGDVSIPKDPDAGKFGKPQWQQHYDALSFFTRLYKKEYYRWLSQLREDYGVKHVDNQRNNLEQTMATHVQTTINHFQLDQDGLHEFLGFLLELHKRYVENEKLKLAKMVKADIYDCVLLLVKGWGQSVGDIESRLNPFQSDMLQRLDPARQTRIVAYETLTGDAILSSFNRATTGQLTASDIDNLLDYLEQSGELSIIIFALHEIHVALNQPAAMQEFRNHAHLTSLLIGLESLMKRLQKADQNMFNLLNSLLPKGKPRKRFEKLRERMQTKHPDNEIDYVEDVLTDNQVDEVTRWFLVAHQMRNHIAHNSITTINFHHQLYRLVAQSACMCILYAWNEGVNQGWV